jgi:hypothetical protein
MPNPKALAREIMTWTQGITGTPAYWWARRGEVGAMVRHMRAVHGWYPLAFHTGSCAEWYWRELHAVFAVAFGARADEAEAAGGRGFAPVENNDEGDADCYTWAELRDAAEMVMVGDQPLAQSVARRVAAYLARFPNIVNDVFVLRTKAWFEIVLGDGLGITDYWYRFEFAKSRGAIHFHALLWGPLSEVMNGFLNKAVTRCFAGDELGTVQAERDAAVSMSAACETHFVGITAEHPAGPSTVVHSAPMTLGEANEEYNRVAARLGRTPKAGHSQWFTDRCGAALYRNSGGYKTWGELDLDGTMELADRVAAPCDKRKGAKMGALERWPAPEGLGEKPGAKTLTTYLVEERARWRRARAAGRGPEPSRAELMGLAEHTDRCSLHGCSEYCIRDGCCRMGFGEVGPNGEKPMGKASRSEPALVHLRGMTNLEAARTHPRMQQCSPPLSRSWGANNDMQIVAAASDTSGKMPDGIKWSPSDGYDVENLYTELEKQHLLQHAGKLDEFHALMRTRRYLDAGEYLERLIDYVVGYACKGEVSVKEAVGLFTTLMKGSEVSDSATMASLAQRINMRLLKQREVSSSEAAFLLGAQAHFHCSRTFKKTSLRAGQWSITEGEDGRFVALSNALDIYWKNNKQEEGAAPKPIQSLAQTVATATGIPVWTGTPNRAQWPLNEAWARGILLAHKPTRKPADVIAGHETYAAALTAFLLDPGDDADPAAVAQIAKEVWGAASAAARGIASSPAESARRREADAPSGMLGEGVNGASGGSARPAVDCESSGDFAEEPLDDNEQQQLDEAENGYGAADDGAALLGPFRFGALQAAFSEAAENTVRSTNAIPPRAANKGQREFLCDMVDHALTAFEAGPANPAGHWLAVRRVFLMGVAGTGKTFTIDLLANALVAVTGKAGALAAFCPTGAAAGAARGRTIDAALGVKRGRATHEPAAGDSLAKLQEENICTHCAVLDEAWMNGCKLLGHASSAAKQVLRGGASETDTDYFGAQVGQVVLTGDPKQLPPVKDKPCFVPVDGNAASSVLAWTGRQAYKAVKRCWQLTQPVRQKEGPFFDALTGLREGKAAPTAVLWQGRALGELPQDQRKAFVDGPDTLYATCFNRDRDKINARYVLTASNVCVVKAALSGPAGHASRKGPSTGAAAGIPLIGYYWIGGMVKLTVNLRPSEGLYNGARGYVVAVVYKDGYKRCGARATAPDDLPVVVVNVPGFSGANKWFETQFDDDGNVVGIDRRKWVPIAPVTRSCDRPARCCSRTGVPLATGKADSVHCCQGMSAGLGKTVRRIIGVWSADAEAKWPGIMYVLASRVQALEDLALAAPSSGGVGLAVDDFAKVGATESWKKTHAEVLALVKKARATRKRVCQQHAAGRHVEHEYGSESHWAALCNEVVARARIHLANPGMSAEDRIAVQSVVDAWGVE